VAEDRVERRLTTILAADVVGYSRLMAADEAGTLTSLKALRRELIEPKTTEHHGRVVKLIGDGTLMEFGSVVDAVQLRPRALDSHDWVLHVAGCPITEPVIVSIRVNSPRSPTVPVRS